MISRVADLVLTVCVRIRVTVSAESAIASDADASETAVSIARPGTVGLVRALRATVAVAAGVVFDALAVSHAGAILAVLRKNVMRQEG